MVKRGSPTDAANAHTSGKRRRRGRGSKKEDDEESSLLTSVDIEVVALGRRLGLDNWSEKQVREAVSPHTPSKIVCWYDCHQFDWPCCRIPIKKDERFNVFYACGTFCSWECAKAYCLQTRTGSASLIAVEANKSRRRFLQTERSVEGGIVLRNLPRKEKLQMFGGNLKIRDFRKGCTRLDGSLIDHEVSLPLSSLKQERNTMRPPAFIDESLVSILRCVSVGSVARPLSQDNSSRPHVTRGKDNTTIQQRISARANEEDTHKTKSNLLSAMGLKIVKK